MQSIALPEPPPSPSPPRTGLTARLDAPLAAGVGTILATVAARTVVGGTLPVPECHWLRWTGIPCPGCGGTRCLAACGRLDLAGAFFWNPLVALLALAFVGWSALALAKPLLAEKVSTRIAGLFSTRRIAILIALNWLYLCWALPR
jgi:hypothetical protein